jgi:hypothetical protein
MANHHFMRNFVSVLDLYDKFFKMWLLLLHTLESAIKACIVMVEIPRPMPIYYMI